MERRTRETENIKNGRVSGLEFSMRSSRFPMNADIETMPKEKDIEFWLQFPTFLTNFVKAEKEGLYKIDNKNECVIYKDKCIKADMLPMFFMMENQYDVDFDGNLVDIETGRVMSPLTSSFEDAWHDFGNVFRTYKNACNLGNTGLGEGHSNFLKGIVVHFELKMSVKQSVEAERYHWFEFVSSQSTMHRITKFNLDDSYDSYTDPRVIEIIRELVNKYNSLEDKNTEEAKELYLTLLHTNPCGFEMWAGMVTNYAQLKTIYYQRKNHRLPEWREFCKWCETLPYFKEFCLSK